MDKIHELEIRYLKFLFEKGTFKEMIQWAEDRLLADENENDEDVILLAGSFTKEEAVTHTEKVLEKFIGVSCLDKNYFIGQYIVELRKDYLAGNLSVDEIEPILWKLFYGSGMPSWLVMLSRNCEYATDIKNFVKPFEDEFNYICSLWEKSSSFDEFEKQYDREISNSHDFKNC